MLRMRAKKNVLGVVLAVAIGGLIFPPLVRALINSGFILRDNETGFSISASRAFNLVIYEPQSNRVASIINGNGPVASIPDNLFSGSPVTLNYTIYAQGYRTYTSGATLRDNHQISVLLTPEIYCGDNVCSPGENISTCHVDCAVCGDNSCSFPTEHQILCSADCHRFIRGDADRNGVVNSNDASAIFSWYFTSTPLPCMDAADANDDGRVSPEDAYKILYSKNTIPAPYPNSPGYDRTGTSLGCSQ